MKQPSVLNVNGAKENEGEPHLCPLQIDVIARSIELWSNEGDVICDPFNGRASTGYAALKMGRKYLGSELKKSYFNLSVKELKSVLNAEQKTLGLAS